MICFRGFPIYILSDVHFGVEESDTSKINRILSRAEGEEAKILVVGDLFDLWIRDEEFLERWFEQQIKILSSRLLAYVVGNHDSPILRRRPLLDPRVYPRLIIKVDDRVWHVEHGHLVGKWRWLFHLLNKWDESWWFRPVARTVAKMWFMRVSGRTDFDPVFKVRAISRAREKGASVAVCGHTHLQEVYHDMTGPFECTYVNPGAGMSGQYLVYREGKFFKEKV